MMTIRKRWLAVGICIVLLLAAAAAFFLLQPQYRLQLTLLGNRHLILEYGTAYTEPGAQALYCNTKASDDALETSYRISGQVDTDVLGVYRLKYTASHEGHIATAYRDVHIVDSVAPVIELVTNPDTYTLPNHPYAEEGFTATDGYDGDLTEQVTRQEADGKVTYTVTDSSGNTATVTRTIVYDDPEAPELTLAGSEEMTVTVGTHFFDPGCKANDNADGDITAKVTVSGSVDIYLPGTYKLTYSVSDTWGNESSVTRQVTVKAKKSTAVISVPSGKNIYLTFDDGPGPHTERLLNILKKYNVKATFFVVNTKYISTVKRIAEEGHTVAIHSASHSFSQIYASQSAYFADLNKMQSIIQQYTGAKSMLLRFPGGSSNTISSNYNKGIMSRLVRSVEAQGYRYFDWNVDSDDAGSATTADAVFKNVTKGISGKKNAIVLQHDIKGFSVDAVERIINWGLANGYSFLPLTESSIECEHPVFN